MNVKHGFLPIAHRDSQLLILGTMPGEKSISDSEYYAHPGNQFRRLVYASLGLDYVSDYAHFLGILKQHKIALWNVLASCEREGSADSNIRNAVPNDVESFVASHAQIRKICFESKKAEMLYDRYFERFPNVEYASLPSSSGLFARMTFDQKLAVWKRELSP